MAEIEKAESADTKVDLAESSILRDFSKEEQPGIRQETAARILESRSLKREKQAKLDELLKTDQGLSELNDKLEDLNKNFLTRWTNCIKIAKTRRDIAGLGVKSEGLQQEIAAAPEIDEATKILTDFYDKMRADWESRDIPEEEMMQAFTKENLGQLNLADYTLLLGKSHTELATHVTRQGVRDHTGMSEHRAGVGEFHNGFVDILQDGRLRSVVGGIYKDGKFSEDMQEYFDRVIDVNASMIRPENGEERDPRYYLQFATIPHEKDERAGSFEDKASVHFGLKAVLDKFYGAESGNEIFFVVPVAHFLADHHISKLKEGNQQDEKDNDLWIYTKDHEGINIDTSIVFIPRSTLVDRKSGSTYDLEDGQDGGHGKITDSERTCTAQDYWENYFSQNPGQKPKRIIYYDGDPNEFVEKWKKENKLDLRAPEVSRQIDEEATKGDYDRYNSVVTREIDKSYPPSEEVQQALGELVNLSEKYATEIAQLKSDNPKLFIGDNGLEQICNYIIYYSEHSDPSTFQPWETEPRHSLGIYNEGLPGDLKTCLDRFLSLSSGSYLQNLRGTLEFDLPYVLAGKDDSPKFNTEIAWKNRVAA